jgi:hypothetical protein
MKQYVVTSLDLNFADNKAFTTKPYINNAWRENSIEEIEKRVISHLFYNASDAYMHVVIKWLNDEEERKLSLRVQDDIWFFGEIEI